jgi:hypothetical protein
MKTTVVRNAREVGVRTCRNFFSAMVMLPSYDPLRLPRKAC